MNQQSPGERLREKLDAMSSEERQKTIMRLFNFIADSLESDEVLDSVMEMSPEELDVELRGMGIDPEMAVARMMETVNACIARYNQGGCKERPIFVIRSEPTGYEDTHICRKHVADMLYDELLDEGDVLTVFRLDDPNAHCCYLEDK